MTIPFFKKEHVSNIVKANGPSPEEQLWAMANNEYWTVLNSSLLQYAAVDPILCIRANALKNALQTFGPASEKLPDFRNNIGNALGHVFHGHVNNSNGTTYVLEWAVVNKEKRILAFIGFDTHENYRFQKCPLKEDQLKKILNSPESKKIMALAAMKVIEAREKVDRIVENSPHFS